MSLEDDIWEATHTLCDKCGAAVAYHEDMTQVIARTGLPGAALIPALWYSRHFLPVVDETGVILCEGSPSRAQYIEGQPRDTRGYPYDTELERIYRQAWAELQASERERD